jgi:hypothetical protein
MAASLTYLQLLRDTRALAAAVRGAEERHKQLASHLDAEAQDTGRIAEQIAALQVDTATVAETREVSRIMQGLSQAALAYAAAADGASRAAAGAEQQTRTDHSGIHQAVQSSPAPMAARGWYTQE